MKITLTTTILLPLLYCDTDSTKSACELLQLLLLHLPLLYCLTDSTTFIQSAHRCKMGKSWRVLVIYTSWVTLSEKIQLPCSFKFQVKADFYCKPTLVRLLSWKSWPFIRKFMHPKSGITWSLADITSPTNVKPFLNIIKFI